MGGELMHRFFGITIQELMELGILEGAKILTGEGGLNRRITRVNVMEVPDILDWVTPGEFLLTTAYSIKDDLNKLKELIPQLDSKGLAGIGIKTKRYIKDIPDDILKLADALNFPIIEIPYDISYSEIILPLLTEIIDNQANILLKIDKFHNRLIQIMLRGGGLKEIAEIIHESSGNSLAIRENIFKTNTIIANEGMASEIEEILVGEENNKAVLKNHITDRSSHFVVKDSIQEKEIRRLSIPIYTEERNYGYIFIWEDKRELSPVELNVIESSTPIIALDLVKKMSIFEIENKHKIDFFDDLFSNDENRHRRALERSTFFNFDKDLNYAVIVISIENIEKHIQATPNNINFLNQLNARLVSIIERLSKFRKEKIILGNKSDCLIFLFGSKKDRSNQDIKKDIFEFCSEIIKYTEVESIKDNILIGIGRNYPRFTELWRSYREASRAAGSLKGGVSDKYIHYDDLGIYRILSYEEIRPEILQFYTEILEPLVKYDKDKDSELVKTLNKFFECKGNLKKISEEMYTHYNTIIYRIQRIEDITGRSLEDHNDRLNIQISLKILEILNEGKI